MTGLRSETFKGDPDMKKLLLLLLVLSLSFAFADPERITDPGINSGPGTVAPLHDVH